MRDTEQQDTHPAGDGEREPGPNGNDVLVDAIGQYGQPDRPANDPDIAGQDLDGVRDLILKAYPDIVPELLAGESVDDLLASVPAARDAYSRIASTIQQQTPVPASIPTGSGRRPAIDPESLSPESKIRAGLRQPSL